MDPKRVLIVTPHFPPVNAPDMQRVRMSLPYFEEFGWKPYVLAVAPTGAEVLDPLLSEGIPADVAVERVRSVALSVTRIFGVGNLAMRALPFLYAAGCRTIAAEDIDLVFFSTTMFLSMPLGRLWKRRFGVPYVLDLQDPWVSDYYETHPDVQAPPKYAFAKRLHRVLEPWTMKQVDGIIAVSPDYIEALCGRYPWLRSTPSRTLPFGASRADFDVLVRAPQTNRHFTADDGRLHGVYVGVAGDVMATALDILFRALQYGLELFPDVFGRVQLHFVGTDYAGDERARQTVTPVAERFGVLPRVSEDTTRIPYYRALQLLKDADFLIVVGSDDPSYTASKIYPYIMAEQPLIAVIHEQSPVVNVINETRAGVVVTFPSSPTIEQRNARAKEVMEQWRTLLAALPYQPDTDWERFERYTARQMTKRQCELFDCIVPIRTAAA